MNERDRQLPPLPVVLRRVLPVAVAVAILCAAVAYYVSAQREEVYTTTALILLRPVAPDPAVPAGSEANFTEGEGLATNVLLVARPGVLRRVAERPEIQLTPAQIGGALQVEGEEGTNIIRVTATTGDPVQAAQVATAVAEEFVEIRRTAARARVREVRALLREQLEALSEGEGSTEARRLLREQIEQLIVREQAPGQQPQVVQEARVPAAPVSPQPRRDAVLAGLLGLVLGAGLGLLRVGTDRRLEGADEMREALGAAVLVTVPSWPTLRRAQRREQLPRRGVQGFRLLHLSLRQHGQQAVRTVAVTDAGPDADADIAAWHLAAAASAARDRVLLVSRGASFNGAGLPERVQPVSLDGGQGSVGFDILPTAERDGDGGRDGEGESGRLEGADILREARDAYDIVVVPTSSMVDDPEAALVVEHMDGVVVAARRGRLERDRIDALRSHLELLGSPVLAVIVDGE